MSDDVQIKAWEVLTCKKGHPMWLALKPYKHGQEYWETERSLMKLGGDDTHDMKAWTCQECGERAFEGKYGQWIFYVKGEERR